MQPPKQRQPIIYIGGAVVIVLLIVLLVGYFTRSNQPATSGTDGKTTIVADPTSHQTVVTQQGKVPETNGSSSSNIPTFLGFDKLIDAGLTVQQVSVLQVALQRYQPLSTGSPQISLAVDDIQSVSPSNSGDAAERWSIKSHIVVNTKNTYVIQLFYSGVSTIQLHLYDAAGQNQLYDSGSLDSTVLYQETSE